VDQRERPPDVPVRECPEPTRPGCVVGLQPGADGLDDQHARQPGGHGLAAGAHLVDLERNEPQGVLQALSCRRSVSGETAAFNRGAIRPHTGRIADTTTPTTFAEFVGSLGIPA
jgi:hypothetical protein